MTLFDLVHKSMVKTPSRNSVSITHRLGKQYGSTTRVSAPQCVSQTLHRLSKYELSTEYCRYTSKCCSFTPLEENGLLHMFFRSP